MLLGSRLTFDKLRGGGIQWPCTDQAPDGTERLYTDHRFNTDSDYCEDYGHDLLTGATYEHKDHAAMRPDGRAVLKAAHYLPPHEPPSAEYPFLLNTGRSVYHWHTRTKTGRARQLDAAAPDVWVELSPADARRLGIVEGDLVRVRSPRGRLEAKARVSGIRDGVVFVPFHYGYWDREVDAEPRAANELTIIDWDPVSKQPIFKTAAVQVEKLADGDGASPAPTTAGAESPTGAGPVTTGGEGVTETTRGGTA